MTYCFKPTLCFGTFFTLLSQARIKGARKKDIRSTDQQVFEALQRVVIGSNYNASSSIDPYKGCYKYRTVPCQGETASVETFRKTIQAGNLGPFRDEIRKLIALFDTTKFQTLVKAVIELVYNSVDAETGSPQISDNELFILDENIVVSKSDLLEATFVNLPYFLMSVYSYILMNCQNNRTGKATYDSWCKSVDGKGTLKKFNGFSGESLKHEITIINEINEQAEKEQNVDLEGYSHYSKSKNTDQSKFLKQYFNSLKIAISDAKLYFSDNSYTSSLQDIYVSLPVDLRIDIKVEDRCVSGIRLVRAEENIEDKEFEDVDETKLGSLLPYINRKVSENVEYKYQDRRKRPKILAPTYAAGEKIGFWELNGIDAAALFQQLVILGEPGCGKSTLFKFFALKLIEQYNAFNNVFEDCSISNKFFETRYVPVFLELRDFVSWYKNKKLSYIDDNTILDFLHEKYTPNWSNKIQTQDIFNHDSIYILDGLDEVTCNTDNRSIVIGLFAHIQALSTNNCQMIISCRARDFTEWNCNKFEVHNMQPMNEYVAIQLIKQIFDAHFIGNNPSDLLDELKRIHIDMSIIGNPLFLSLIAQLYLETQSDFPNTKSKILKESILLLLKRKPCETLDRFLGGVNDLFPALEAIAYDIQCSVEKRLYRIDKENLARIICVAIDYCSLADLSNFLASTTGLLTNSGENVYEFTHRHFQEYLCASYLYNQTPIKAAKIISTGLEEEKRIWAEAAILYLEIMRDYKDIDRIVITIQQLLYNGAKGWSAWYIALNIEILNEQDNKTVESLLSPTTIEQLRKLFLSVFGDIDSLPTRERAFCGKILGNLGDLRCGVGLDDKGLPDIVWCKIDAGTYKLGADDNIKKIVKTQLFGNRKWGENVGFKREEPQIDIQLDAFFIAKYPVTVAQFNAFVEANDGYFCQDSWTWSPVGYRWYEVNVENKNLEQIKSAKGKSNSPNYPVTDVSWIEAVSFCQWLSKKTGHVYRLPTEGEWEATARKNYPIFAWGNDFNPDKGNCSFSATGDIVPVGTFEPFVDSYMPSDMNGNVWEWCYSVYPAWDSNDENLLVYNENKNIVAMNNVNRLTMDTMCSVRGGSYINTPMFLMNFFRGRDKISLSFYRQGFRLVKEIKPHSVETSMMFEEGGAKTQHLPDKYFKIGSGALVTVGDRVRLSYSVKKGDEVIEDMISSVNNLEVVLGRGQLQPEIDAFILNHQACIGTAFEDVFSVCTLGVTEAAEKYTFYVQIMDRL